MKHAVPDFSSPLSPAHLHLHRQVLIPPSTSSLDARGVFVVIPAAAAGSDATDVSPAVWTWVGKDAAPMSGAEVVAAALCRRIVSLEKLECEVIVVRQGEEPAAFWAALGCDAAEIGTSSAYTDLPEPSFAPSPPLYWGPDAPATGMVGAAVPTRGGDASTPGGDAGVADGMNVDVEGQGEDSTVCRTPSSPAPPVTARPGVAPIGGGSGAMAGLGMTGLGLGGTYRAPPTPRDTREDPDDRLSDGSEGGVHIGLYELAQGEGGVCGGGNWEEIRNYEDLGENHDHDHDHDHDHETTLSI